MRVTVFVRPSCPLCDPVLEALRSAGISYEPVDITANEALEARYGLSIPVVEVDGEIVFDGGMDPSDLPGLITGL